MATLQKIRSKGPLVVIVVGLALFAFIAGDAWQVMRPHQSQDIGEVNGESLSAQDYQALVEEYTEVVKFTQNVNSLTNEQVNMLQDQVWQTYVENKLIETEAEKLGLVVSDAELQAIINQGTHPMLQNTPFRNPQTGAFDQDMLKKFLVDYSKMNTAQMPSEYAEYYQKMYNYWSFIEKTLVQTRLREKYMSLIGAALISNPVEAQNAFDARVKQTDLLLAAIPYTAVSDSAVTVSDAELKAAYDEKKEQYFDLNVPNAEAIRNSMKEKNEKIKLRNEGLADVDKEPLYTLDSYLEKFGKKHFLDSKDYKNLMTKMKGFAALRSIIVFALVYRFLVPILVTKPANIVCDKYLAHKKAKDAQKAQQVELKPQNDVKTAA